MRPDAGGPRAEHIVGRVPSGAADSADGLGGRHGPRLALDHLPAGDDAQLRPGTRLDHLLPARLQQHRPRLRRGRHHDQTGPRGAGHVHGSGFSFCFLTRSLFLAKTFPRNGQFDWGFFFFCWNVGTEQSGKIVWAKHSEIQQANLKALADGDAVKDGAAAGHQTHGRVRDLPADHRPQPQRPPRRRLRRRRVSFLFVVTRRVFPSSSSSSFLLLSLLRSFGFSLFFDHTGLLPEQDDRVIIGFY